MEYLTLNNGVRMPVIGLGTWDIRGESGMRAVSDALEAGYRLIDTAQMQSWASFTEGRRNIFAEPLLVEIGVKYGKTSGQTALRYLIQNGIAVIPKSVQRERLEENLDILDFELSQDEMRQIGRLDGGTSLFGWY